MSANLTRAAAVYNEGVHRGLDPSERTPVVTVDLTPEEYRARLMLVIEDIRNDPANRAWREAQDGIERNHR